MKKDVVMKTMSHSTFTEPANQNQVNTFKLTVNFQWSCTNRQNPYVLCLHIVFIVYSFNNPTYIPLDNTRCPCWISCLCWKYSHLLYKRLNLLYFDFVVSGFCRIGFWFWGVAKDYGVWGYVINWNQLVLKRLSWLCAALIMIMTVDKYCCK